jgi:hypothetical protein
MKKLLSRFCRDQEQPPLADHLDMPLLLELLDTHNVRGPAYRAFAQQLIEKVFLPSRGLEAVSPFLHEVYLVLREDHQEELVHSLLGDLAFEAVYFTYDLGQINNSPYRKDQALSHKKVLALLRAGGFSSFGF